MSANTKTSTETATANLTAAGATRKASGWYQDGVFLAAEARQAWRLLVGGG